MVVFCRSRLYKLDSADGLAITIDNVAESSITSSLVVRECSLLDTGCEMKAFLYDYINDNTTVDNERSAIILFGYTE